MATSSACSAPGPGSPAGDPTAASSPRCSPRPTPRSPASTAHAPSSHAATRHARSSATRPNAARSPADTKTDIALDLLYDPACHRLDMPQPATGPPATSSTPPQRHRATSAPGGHRAGRVNSSAAIQRRQQNPKEHTMATATRRSPQAAPALGLARQMLGDPRHGPLPPLLLVLTAVTGLVDAVSILRLGRVFVANMTGNVVFTGFAIVGTPGFSLSASLFALAGFLAGAALGGMLVSRTGHDRALLLLSAAASELILVATALAVAASVPVLSVPRDILAALLAAAMGIQNAAARRLAVPTMTLTGIAADLRARNHGPAQLRRLLAVATMLAGAVAGAWLVLRISPAAALGLAASLLAVVTTAAAAAARRPGKWRQSTT